LHPLHFFVVLNLLCICRILNLTKLRFQIIQYFFYFARCALNILVKLTTLFYRNNSSVGSSK
jgi:hypothetical protein